MASTRRFFLKATVGAAAGLLFPSSIIPAESPSRERTQQFVWNPQYSFEWAHHFPYNVLTAMHPSPVDKYQLLFDQLRSSGIINQGKVRESAPLREEDFLQVHSSQYLHRLERLAETISGLLNRGDILTPQVLDFVKASCAGTYDAAVRALSSGRAMNLSGGFHHAFPNHEEGFCHLNDVAVAIRKLQRERKVKKVMIVDLDVHHG